MAAAERGQTRLVSPSSGLIGDDGRLSTNEQVGVTRCVNDVTTTWRERDSDDVDNNNDDGGGGGGGGGGDGGVGGSAGGSGDGGGGGGGDSGCIVGGGGASWKERDARKRTRWKRVAVPVAAEVTRSTRET